jgi:hypothetical protein
MRKLFSISRGISQGSNYYYADIIPLNRFISGIDALEQFRAQKELARVRPV